jgi:hydroxymethylpyrimidine/phosphomethylpyrimidine kinase
VTGVHPVPPEFVSAQLHTLLDDVPVQAAKLGMLGTAPVVREVAAVLAERRPGPVVCDPVMVATSGDRLVDEDAVRAVRSDLLPLADLITPNVPEAAALLSTASATSVAELTEQTHALLRLGPRAVLAKGGHLGGAVSVDVLATRDGVRLTSRPRLDTSGTHGTGAWSRFASVIGSRSRRAPSRVTGTVSGLPRLHRESGPFTDAHVV